uniref:ATP synthase complex subunit 8 n=1 Tax=Tarbinskiellus portentosus TaxID=2732766 RepID=A0A8F9RZL9_9ORTH|nr:ATP synthase F0 subunit 8 [Tarbinskiellus portentosus]UBU97845.1 ATP synthase F0 subunit 8 [Tarbinskiellus sp.]DAZ85805.1 TPA_asm: ATP synthase F0 subunit 8 [Tarbinskiellus portentosus]
MPQMAPMNWLMLLLFFIIIMIIMMTLNYYITQPSFTIKEQLSLKSNSVNWKW